MTSTQPESTSGETPVGSTISDPKAFTDSADSEGAGDSDNTGDDLDAPDPA